MPAARCDQGQQPLRLGEVGGRGCQGAGPNVGGSFPLPSKEPSGRASHKALKEELSKAISGQWMGRALSAWVPAAEGTVSPSGGGGGYL